MEIVHEVPVVMADGRTLKATVESFFGVNGLAFSVSAPFDLSEHRTTFNTVGAAKGALTRYIKKYKRGEL